MDKLLLYNDLVNSLLSDIWTLSLSFIGGTISIITLLVSFILNKRDELKLIVEQIKQGNKSPLIMQRRKFVEIYILRLKSINKRCFYIFICSSVLALYSWIELRILNDRISLWPLFILFSCTLFLILYIIILIIKMFYIYRKDSKF